ncbi:MAG: aminopeptidase N [Myxococcota bacterium]|nr:aminopeptidase N [Deltaproteobacteria bacterium]
MQDEKPTAVYRADYREPDYWIDAVDLEFELGSESTRVTARLEVRRNADLVGDPPPLVLNGEELEHQGLWIDGTEVSPSAYDVGPEALTIEKVPSRFELTTQVLIYPDQNTTLMGLYRTNGNFCTQCEAMGFRRITWFLDRPDVMARYTTTITASSETCPILLSNGNRVSAEALSDGRHRVRWEDPFPKPSYLFALVAGDLQCHRDTFQTVGGREVALEIWVEPQNIKRCGHAMESLKHSMRWDEEVYGLEYDLDIFMIVAVNDFNAGAMENKGLNIFNSKYILADPETATDADYANVESVVAHEYFHNWTGNRVTCRDWFQLTLKEGLTVFRDQNFSATMGSAAVERISSVQQLRSAQFSEDSGPMAHPIRPDSYIAMDNFYTTTVYEKGAEVIRMYQALVGQSGFRKGMDLYFERHDGHAVTCDDFRSAMADANGQNFDQFGRWYSQAGTPMVDVSDEYDENSGVYTLKFSQSYADLGGDSKEEDGRAPVPIPVATALLDSSGHSISARLLEDSSMKSEKADEWILEFTEAQQEFQFEGVLERPIPSLLRGFSAPVRLKVAREPETLAFLMRHETDAFNRWDAGQELASRLLIELSGRSAQGQELVLDPFYSEAFEAVLSDPDLDGSLKTLALNLPSEKVLGQEMETIEPDALHEACAFMRQSLGREHLSKIESLWAETRDVGPYRQDREAIDRRRFSNCLLGYAVAAGSEQAIDRVWTQLDQADNMTDAQAALTLLLETDSPLREQGLLNFYDRWKTNPLVLDKWFSIQALCSRENTLDSVLALAEHPDFSLRNPNRLRSLVGSFCAGNQVRFHAADGAGYAFLGQIVSELNQLNPQVAARMVSIFNPWRRFDSSRQSLMRSELESIAALKDLSKPVFEIVSRALEG